MTSRTETSAAARGVTNGPVKVLWGVAATLLSVLYTFVLVIPAALFAPVAQGRVVARIARLWGRIILFTCGVRLQIEGLENLAGLPGYVLAANHQSLLDILALAAYMPGQIRFVAKKELLRLPLFGVALAHSGHIVIDRETGGRAIRKAIEGARMGLSFCVFAEGHRFSDNQVHEFSDGAAWLAIATHLPCIPTTICGSAALMPRGSLIVNPGRKMLIRLGTPIPAAGLRSADRHALTRRLEEAVRSALVTEP